MVLWKDHLKSNKLFKKLPAIVSTFSLLPWGELPLLSILPHPTPQPLLQEEIKENTVREYVEFMGTELGHEWIKGYNKSDGLEF